MRSKKEVYALFYNAQTKCTSQNGPAGNPGSIAYSALPVDLQGFTQPTGRENVMNGNGTFVGLNEITAATSGTIP